MMDQIEKVLDDNKDLESIHLLYLILRELETLNKKKTKDRITEK